MLYLWIFLFKIPFSPHTLFQLFLSFLTSVGFAALGYFINEFFDRDDDKIAGKKNRLSRLNTLQICSILFAILCCIIVPWLDLPANILTVWLILFQLSLFWVYAAPPFRLKNNTIIAPILDSLYAYVSPLLLAVHTFFLISQQQEMPQGLIFCIGLLFFLAGYRNIIIHYINDFETDQRLDKKTVVKSLGVRASKSIVKKIAYAEYAFMLLFITAIIIINPKFSLFSFTILITIILQLLLYKYSKPIFTTPFSQLPNTLYQFYFPIFILLTLILHDIKWAFWLPFHLTFLIPYAKYKPITSWWQRINFRKGYIAVKQVLSWFVNYAIFIFFLMLGVNLRKKNMSAKSFIKTKINTPVN